MVMHENNGYIWQLEKAPKTVDFISINRTLLVQKLTDNTPIRPIIVRDLTSIEAVFAHFKPKVNIEFKDNQGNIHFETLRFTSIEDFGKKGIVKQSHFLQSQNYYSEDDLQELLRQLRANIALRKMLKDVDAKEAFLAVIRIMMDELLNFSTISSSTFHDLLGAGTKQQGSTGQNSREDANQLFK